MCFYFVPKLINKNSIFFDEMEYIDYNLGIGRDLKITASSGSASEKGELKLDRNVLESAMKELEDEKARVGRDSIKNVGIELAKALFTPEIKKHFYTVKSNSANRGIRIRLTIESPEVSAYPWEALYENNKYMATSVETSLTRFIPDATPDKRNFDRPLKILVIGSNPSRLGLTSVQVDREIEIIKGSLEEEIKNDNIMLDTEPLGDVARIMVRLNNEQYNIVHFIGHGVFEDGTGYLALESDEGGLVLYDQEKISQIFQNQLTLGLVVLNACQGAMTSTSKAFTGLAPELIKMGVPSVIAMKYSISNPTAKLFSEEFYRNLTKMPIDENIQRVRHRILVDPKASAKDFIIPVLFMKAPVIFCPRDAAAKEMTQSSGLNKKMEELKKDWDELAAGSEAIDLKDFWLKIWWIYRDNRNELKNLNITASKKLDNMIAIIPGLIREREEALEGGLNESARGFEQTLKLNFKKFMETFQ